MKKGTKVVSIKDITSNSLFLDGRDTVFIPKGTKGKVTNVSDVGLVRVKFEEGSQWWIDPDKGEVEGIK